MQAVFASEQPAQNYRQTDIRYLQLLHASIPNKQRKKPRKDIRMALRYCCMPFVLHRINYFLNKHFFSYLTCV
jgi:hypothetical protein